MRQRSAAWTSSSCFIIINETKEGQKKCLRFSLQQFVIQFANRFQLGPQLLIIPQPALDLGLLFRSNGKLAGPPSGITHGQNPNPMPLSPPTLATSLAVENLAIEQRTPHDLRRIGQSLGEALTGVENLLSFHQ